METTAPRQLGMEREGGNVLFLILLAVVLFAALSYAVTQSSRSGSGDVSREQSKLLASQIMGYSSSLEGAVMRLRLNGCADTEISFENPINTNYVNGAAPSSKKCHVFDPAGGGLSWQNPPPKALDATSAAASGFAQAASLLGTNRIDKSVCVAGVGTGADENCYLNAAYTDLVFFVPWINQSTCLAIDQALGFSSIPIEGGTTYGGNGNEFQGTFTAGAPLSLLAYTFDQREACFQHDPCCWPGGGYHYYRVLIAR